jgi:hypothetical protein
MKAYRRDYLSLVVALLPLQIVGILFFLGTATTFPHKAYAEPKGILQVINKSPLKVEAITPVAEYFKTEKRKSQDNTIQKLDLFKTGYHVQVHNLSRKSETVKMELILNYLGQGRVFSYIAYDVIGPGKSQKVLLMCDNIPVECRDDKRNKASQQECRDYSLSVWERHVKRLIIECLK